MERAISGPAARPGHYPGVARSPVSPDGDDAGKGEKDYTETVYLITSLDAGAASPRAAAPHRGRTVPTIDAVARGGPANRARRSNRREAESLAETRRRLQLDRREAIAALTRP